MIVLEHGPFSLSLTYLGFSVDAIWTFTLTLKRTFIVTLSRTFYFTFDNVFCHWNWFLIWRKHQLTFVSVLLSRALALLPNWRPAAQWTWWMRFFRELFTTAWPSSGGTSVPDRVCSCWQCVPDRVCSCWQCVPDRVCSWQCVLDRVCPWENVFLRECGPDRVCSWQSVILTECVSDSVCFWQSVFLTECVPDRACSRRCYDRSIELKTGKINYVFCLTPILTTFLCIETIEIFWHLPYEMQSLIILELNLILATQN